MKLGVFVNQYTKTNSTLDRIKTDNLGIILVQNGVYHAALKENGKDSDILSKAAKVYALSEDVISRGLSPDKLDKKVTVVDYNGLVDVIFNDYEKFIWL
ncbi:MAG: sulfurtransferase complex subunit TusB [Nitrospirae bacterium]|nr:sulfurtransferase complex subunit TusB [Nitrospirota bacterium]MBF0539963.1 sulfurtransferase complex subunit TusB [Nitrospirota bacterium]